MELKKRTMFMQFLWSKICSCKHEINNESSNRMPSDACENNDRSQCLTQKVVRVIPSGGNAYCDIC